MNKLLETAIVKAGPILIVTAAGGTFGAVIKESGIVNSLGQYVAALGLGIFIPYIIAVLLKTSQGSSTIATITAASIVAPLLDSLGLSGEWGKTLHYYSVPAVILSIVSFAMVGLLSLLFI